MEEPTMTEAQRDELKALCQKADVPDKSGEMLTQEGALTSTARDRGACFATRLNRHPGSN
jgi:hypothetical protein